MQRICKLFKKYWADIAAITIVMGTPIIIDQTPLTMPGKMGISIGIALMTISLWFMKTLGDAMREGS